MQNSGIKIYDFTPFTQLDFPNTLAAILWLAGCNMRCPYCHNPDIVFGKNSLSFDEVIKFLKKRKNILEGVVISGGEPTLHQDIVKICSMIKSLGYKIKLDTNGTKPKVLKKLLKENLIDYVAIDFKSPKGKFKKITGLNCYDDFLKSLKLLIDSKIELEIRTTVHTSLINKNDIEEIIKILKEFNYIGDYFLQNFIDSGKLLKKLEKQKCFLDLALFKNIKNIKFRNFGYENV